MTIDIPLSTAWPDNVTADQVRKQAIEEATNALRIGFVIEGLVNTMKGHAMDKHVAYVVGDPKVLVIMAEK